MWPDANLFWALIGACIGAGIVGIIVATMRAPPTAMWLRLDRLDRDVANLNLDLRADYMRLRGIFNQALAVWASGFDRLEAKMQDVGQQIIDKVTNLTTVDESLGAAIDTLIQQDTDVANQLRALQAQLDAGNTITAADLQTVLTQLDNNVASMTDKKTAVQTAITANTIAAPGATPPAPAGN